MTEQAIRSMVAYVLTKQASMVPSTVTPARKPLADYIDKRRQILGAASNIGLLGGALAGTVPVAQIAPALAPTLAADYQTWRSVPEPITSPQKEGFPWGTLAKWALIAALLGGGLYGGYKLYNWMTKPAPKRRRRIVEEIDEDEE